MPAAGEFRAHFECTGQVVRESENVDAIGTGHMNGVRTRVRPGSQPAPWNESAPSLQLDDQRVVHLAGLDLECLATTSTRAELLAARARLNGASMRTRAVYFASSLPSAGLTFPVQPDWPSRTAINPTR